MIFRNYLTNMTGPAAKEMIDAHAHHILFKIGSGKEQKELVEEAQAILRKYSFNGCEFILYF